jgi:hypothetical protein
MNLEAKGEGMGILYRIVLGDAYYRAPGTYAVADNTGGNSSSTADDDKITYEQGYDYGFGIGKNNPTAKELEFFEILLNGALARGEATEDYAKGAREGLAVGLNQSVTSAPTNTTPNTPTPSNGNDITTFTPKYGSNATATHAINSGGNAPSGGTLDEKLKTANDNRNKAEDNYDAAYQISRDFLSAPVSSAANNAISKYFSKYDGEMPEYNGYAIYGEVVNGVPNGYCVLRKVTGYSNYGFTEDTGDYSMEGTFVNGKLNGEGRVINGDIIIVGDFVDGLPSGKVHIADNTGDYWGNYKGGQFNGIGRYKDKDGNEWYGEWSNGKLNGYAKLYDVENSTYYAGYFSDGVPSGAGYVTNINYNSIAASMNGTGTEYIGEAWGYFNGFEMTEVYRYHEITSDEKTAILNKALADTEAASAIISATLNEANGIILQGNASSAKIWTDSAARIDLFEKSLEARQPAPQFKLAPNWGFDEEGLFISGN